MKKIIIILLLIISIISGIETIYANSDNDKIILGYHMEWNKIDLDVMYFDDLIIENIDAETFENPKSINMDYGHDKDNVYYMGEYTMKGLDPKNYTIGLPTNQKNENNIYISYDEDTFCLKEQCIQVENPSAPQFIGDGLIRFGKKLYIYNEWDEIRLIVENSNPEHFITGYKITPDAVYWYGVKIKDVDLNSFEIMKCDCLSETAKDKNNVYFKSSVIYKSDTKSFNKIVVDEARYCADKYGFYNKDKMNLPLNEMKKLAPNDINIINQSIKSSILEYKEKYPNYSPQPAIDPNNPQKFPILNRLKDKITDYKFINPPIYYSIIYVPILVILGVAGFVIRRKRKR